MAEENKKEKAQEVKPKKEAAKVEAKAASKPVAPKTEAPQKAAAPQAEKKAAKPVPGILGKKIGMAQIFNEKGEVIPVTVVEAGPCIVLQKKTAKNDGYNAIQVGFAKVKKPNKPQVGHAKAAGKSAYNFIREFKVEKLDDFTVGEEIKVNSFKPGDLIDVCGISIGKGFAGTIKRHHFARGPMSHGSKNHRLPGSIGAGTTPGRVFKGTKMSGRMGGVRVTVPKVSVASIDEEKNLLLLAGTVPGKKNNFVTIRSR